MLKSETFNRDLAPAPHFLRMLLAVFVATAVGAASGFAVVLAFLNIPAAETQPVVMRTKAITDAAGASNSGIQRKEPPSTLQWELNSSSVGRPTDTTDTNSKSARSQRLPGRADTGNDGLSEAPRETENNAAVTATATSAEGQEQTKLDRKPPPLVIHRGRAYSRRFANTPLTSPLSRPW